MRMVLQTRGCRGCAALRLLGAVPHPPAAESALHPVRWLVQAASSAPVPASPCPTGTVGTWICCPCLRTSLCPRLRASVLTVPGGGEVPVTDHRGALSLIAWVHLTLWAGGVWPPGIHFKHSALHLFLRASRSRHTSAASRGDLQRKQVSRYRASTSARVRRGQTFVTFD